MRVFLTGGTGFIGKPLVQALRRRNWQVIALVRRPDSPEASVIASLGAQLAHGDVTNRESMCEAMRGADIVIHNAGSYEFGLTPEAARHMQVINVDGTKNVLGLALELGIAKIVHVSTIVAAGRTDLEIVDEGFQRRYPATTIYEATKADAHQVALEHQRRGAPISIASPAGVVGPGDHSSLGYLARMYVRGYGLPLMPMGRRATVHVDDCAEAIALTAEKGKIAENYILSGGVMSYQEMFETWKTTPGGPKFMLYLPRPIGEIGCGLMEPLQRLLHLPNVLSREVFTTGSVNWCYSGAKAERELGLHFRDAQQAWLDTLEGERQRAQAGKSWRNLKSSV
jgi:dihydroflavonol-4-reductase